MKIKIETTINKNIEKVWDFYTKPEHIVKWNTASEDWHTTKAENDLRPGGTFSSRMEAKDKSEGFDFTGTYTNVIPFEKIQYKMTDDRKVEASFQPKDQSNTHITIEFDPENENSLELQQQGWQAILDNFKKYVEASI
jgi:uncharacterized protein YndB with AHSA1/START domain